MKQVLYMIREMCCRRKIVRCNYVNEGNTNVEELEQNGMTWSSWPDETVLKDAAWSKSCIWLEKCVAEETF